MPNQLSPKKQRVSISMPQKLVQRIDTLANRLDRDRTYIIKMLVLQQLQQAENCEISPYNELMQAEDEAE